MSEKTDPEVQDAYERELGRLVSIFNRMEGSLYQLCRATLQTSDEKAAIVFFRNQHFGSRLDLTADLLEAHLTRETDIAAWMDLKAKIGSVQAVRNAAVHSTFGRHRTIRVGPSDKDFKSTEFYGAKRSAQEEAVIGQKRSVSRADLAKANRDVASLLPQLTALLLRARDQPAGRRI